MVSFSDLPIKQAQFAIFVGFMSSAISHAQTKKY